MKVPKASKSHITHSHIHSHVSREECEETIRVNCYENSKCPWKLTSSASETKANASQLRWLQFCPIPLLFPLKLHPSIANPMTHCHMNLLLYSWTPPPSCPMCNILFCSSPLSQLSILHVFLFNIVLFEVIMVKKCYRDSDRGETAE